MNKLVTSATVKWVACITMLIDHIGAVLLPQATVLRDIGRLSFPLFIFLLVEGFTHTKSRMKYFMRLLLFAVLSEIPYDLAFYVTKEQMRRGVFYATVHCNVIWTLLLGFLFMAFFEATEMRIGLCVRTILAAALCLAALCVVADMIQCDYRAYGVVAIAVTYLMRRFSLPAWMMPVAVAFLLMINPLWETECYAIFDAPFLYFYNGEKGRSYPKYAFYAFYPLHLLLLAGMKTFL